LRLCAHRRTGSPGSWLLEVAICANLVGPGPVNIFERWESQAALETFQARPDTEQRMAMHAVYVQKHDIADAGHVRGGRGMDRSDGSCCDR
jgi:hypothetical protein